MDAARWRQIDAVIAEILETAEGERVALLDRRCAGDRDLRAEIEALLRADAAAGRFLGVSALSALADTPAIDTRVGPYRLLREIGRGGMGIVYLAEREDAYRQRVAIKIVGTGFDERLRRRFEHERQILATLDHPNIARLLDGGTTAQGFPYLVMEYVDGEPITAYCDRHRLTVRDRLSLYRTVCAAVQYAHQHLVVHRDLKPANLLVTADGTSKLLDFGVARLLHEPAASASPTVTGIHPMTPDYASPEQLLGEPVTTASDVYALGVILYELVCGRQPYTLASRSAIERREAVLDTPPRRPSSHATASAMDIAERRSTTPDRLARALAGDIDTLVLMAMRTEPQRRYGSAAAMGDDIRRHLEAFPVLARNDTVGYRMGRFVRRHTTAVIGAGLAATAIVGGAVFAGAQAQRALAERARAEQRFDDSRRFTVSLVADLAALGDASAATVRGVFGEKTAAHLDALAAEVTADPSLQSDVASAYMQLGDFQGHPAFASLGNASAALASYQKGVDLLERLAATRPSDETLAARLNEAYTARAIAWLPTDVAASLASHQRALAVGTRLATMHPDDVRLQLELSHDIELAGERYGHPYYGNLGNTARALADIQRSLSMRERWAPRLSTDRADPSGRYRLMLPDIYKLAAGMSWATGDLPSAVTYQKRALDLYQRVLDESPSGLVYARAELGLLHARFANLLLEQGREAEAGGEALAAMAILEPMFTADRSNGVFRRDLTRAYNQAGDVLLAHDPGHALERYRQGKALGEEFLAHGPQEPEVRERLADSLRGIAGAATALGDRATADDSSRAAVALADALVATDAKNAHYAFSRVLAYRTRGDVLMTAGDRPAADAAYHEALAAITPLATTDPASWLKRRALTDLHQRAAHAHEATGARRHVATPGG